MAEISLLPNNHTAGTVSRMFELNYGDSVVLGTTTPGQKPGEKRRMVSSTLEPSNKSTRDWYFKIAW
jgi:hypothetical protein